MDDTKPYIREVYGRIARGQQISCCANDSASSAPSCCPRGDDAVVAEADLGLGCGMPLQFAALQKGEIVVDLGSGPGLDCFNAAEQVGPDGKVVGVDMTPEMIDRARNTAAEHGYDNVEFRLGEIEHLPVPDNSADVVMSNCVINLAVDKLQVFREACRVLKPGGRLAIADIVLQQPLPRELAQSIEAWAGCLAGAVLLDDYLSTIRNAGLCDVRMVSQHDATELLTQCGCSDPLLQAAVSTAEECGQSGLAGLALSVIVCGRKPS